ncbi:MAG TPA: DUF459 domain-containing protein [Roseiarcus sp.]|nr:DUF459 domain-containing protein [Roseiarcus sp.]
MIRFPQFKAAAAAFALACFVVGAARAETPAPTRLHIAFIGDSMADGLWGAMYRRLGKDKCLGEKIKLLRKARNGTGLTRLDQFNWVDEIGKIVEDFHPDLTVGSFGINDRQGIVEKDRRSIAYPSEAYDIRYTELVVDVVRSALAQGGSMMIIGLPVLMEADANNDALAKNKIFEAAIKQVASDKATYVQPWTSGATPDVFKPYLPNARNNMVMVRAPDGIHFTRVGYDMVMDAVFPSILASLKARGHDLEAECPSRVGAR